MIVYLVVEREDFESDYIHGAFYDRVKAEKLKVCLTKDKEEETGHTIDELMVSYFIKELEVK